VISLKIIAPEVVHTIIISKLLNYLRNTVLSSIELFMNSRIFLGLIPVITQISM